jgi:hypothetical protein
LWEEPDWVVKVFLTMLAVKDADQVVRVNAYGLGRKCWPRDDGAEARVLEALKVLSSPDKRRLEPQPHEGRRIEKVAEGWFILNGQTYEDMMRKINRKAYQAEWQAGYRQKKKGASESSGKKPRYRKSKPGTPLPGENAGVKALGDGDQEAFDRYTEPNSTRHP